MLEYETNEKLKIQKVILGLNHRIRIVINLHQFNILQKAYDMVRKEEGNQKFKRNNKDSSSKHNSKRKFDQCK